MLIASQPQQDDSALQLSWYEAQGTMALSKALKEQALTARELKKMPEEKHNWRGGAGPETKKCEKLHGKRRRTLAENALKTSLQRFKQLRL